MPTISIFYGITVYMFYFDDKNHHKPHIHINYAEYDASISIESGEIIACDFPKKKLKLVQAWIEIHKDELNADWKLAIQGDSLFKIAPLQ
jgi:hypothetical protein